MEILVLNEDFETVFIMDTFESLIWTDRYSKYGDFEIYTSADRNIVKSIKEDYYLWCEESEHMMIVEDRKLESDVERGNHFIVTGRSLESILDRRIVWTQTNLDGYIDGQIKKLIDNSVVNPSDPNRKIPNFIFEESDDPFIQSLTVRAQFTGDSLYDAVKKLCESVNIGFKITLNDQNQFVFKLYSGLDRSYAQTANPFVVFSPSFENIINSDYFESKRLYKTIALVAGEGEGTARRTVVVGDDNVSGLSRREMFVDARDISSQTSSGTLNPTQYDYLLTQRGLENKSEAKIIQAFTGQVETTQMYRFGEHFFMGDITQLENEYGMESRVRVIEFIHSENQSGILTYPTFEVIEQEEVS